MSYLEIIVLLTLVYTFEHFMILSFINSYCCLIKIVYVLIVLLRHKTRFAMIYSFYTAFQFKKLLHFYYNKLIFVLLKN